MINILFKRQKKRPSQLKDNKNLIIRNTTYTHYKDDNECNIKLKIENIDDINKKCDSIYCNRADIDEFDSPGLILKMKLNVV